MSEFELEPIGRRPGWKASVLIAVVVLVIGWLSTGNLERKMSKRAFTHCLKTLPEKECEARIEFAAHDCFEEHFDRDADRIGVDDYLRCVLAPPEATPTAPDAGARPGRPAD